ncbi:MAG: hypothetical protein JRN23_01925 [Nitrososphaerota archaeon]|nr:hypothetical protein [Nitrososphaerota archaeon]
MEQGQAAPSGLRSFTFEEALEAGGTLGTLGTGCTGLDSMLGGGYEEGKLTEVHGPSNSGKTQLAIQATVMAAARGWTSVYVDTESTFRPERLAQIAERRGLDPQDALARVFSVRADDVDAQVRVVSRIKEDPRVSPAKLVVVDTVTKNFTLEFPGAERVGKRQGALAVYLNSVSIDAYLRRRVVLLTNRVASVTRDGVSVDVGVGGLTLGRFLSKSVRLSRDGAGVLAVLDQAEAPRPPARAGLSERGVE